MCHFEEELISKCKLYINKSGECFSYRMQIAPSLLIHSCYLKNDTDFFSTTWLNFDISKAETDYIFEFLKSRPFFWYPYCPGLKTTIFRDNPWAERSPRSSIDFITNHLGMMGIKRTGMIPGIQKYDRFWHLMQNTNEMNTTVGFFQKNFAILLF